MTIPRKVVFQSNQERRNPSLCYHTYDNLLVHNGVQLAPKEAYLHAHFHPHMAFIIAANGQHILLVKASMSVNNGFSATFLLLVKEMSRLPVPLMRLSPQSPQKWVCLFQSSRKATLHFSWRIGFEKEDHQRTRKRLQLIGL